MDYDKMISYLDHEIEKSKKVMVETSESPVKADIRLHYYHMGVVEALSDVRLRATLAKRRLKQWE